MKSLATAMQSPRYSSIKVRCAPPLPTSESWCILRLPGIANWTFAWGGPHRDANIHLGPAEALGRQGSAGTQCSEGVMKQTFAIGIGGAAGQGVATPGDIFAKIFSRRGLNLNAYNAYQSIIRGGHTLLTIRTGPEKVTNMGDRMDLLIPLNQDTMDRHLQLLTAGAACIYNADTIKPGPAADGVQLCPLPVSELADISRNKVAQNTLAMGAGLQMMGIGFQALEEVLREQFKKKGEAVVAENVGVARAGFDYAAAHFSDFPNPVPKTENRYAILSGNVAMAMGGAAAGVKFYCAYPMSPSTGVLHWMAEIGRASCRERVEISVGA